MINAAEYQKFWHVLSLCHSTGWSSVVQTLKWLTYRIWWSVSNLQDHLTSSAVHQLPNLKDSQLSVSVESCLWCYQVGTSLYGCFVEFGSLQPKKTKQGIPSWPCPMTLPLYVFMCKAVKSRNMNPCESSSWGPKQSYPRGLFFICY